MNRSKRRKSRNTARGRRARVTVDVYVPVMVKRGRKKAVAAHSVVKAKGGGLVWRDDSATATAEVRNGQIKWHGPHGSSSSGRKHRDALGLARKIMAGRPRCSVCGTPIERAARTDKLYCSPRCRQAAYRARKPKKWVDL